jgi:S-DNA-T family DNA segregation ATPase FtsK/SpoIIIE
MAGSRRYSLVVTDGPEAGRTFPLAPPSVTIGREGTDLELDDPEVSRQHASIEIGDEGVTLKDLGSRNGTYVGDERVSEAEIFHHDEFRVGSNVFMLVVTEVE